MTDPVPSEGLNTPAATADTKALSTYAYLSKALLFFALPLGGGLVWQQLGWPLRSVVLVLLVIWALTWLLGSAILATAGRAGTALRRDKATAALIAAASIAALPVAFVLHHHASVRQMNAAVCSAVRASGYEMYAAQDAVEQHSSLTKDAAYDRGVSVLRVACPSVYVRAQTTTAKQAAEVKKPEDPDTPSTAPDTSGIPAEIQRDGPIVCRDLESGEEVEPLIDRVMSVTGDSEEEVTSMLAEIIEDECPGEIKHLNP